MTKMVQHMLRDSLRSFLSQDAVLAREVCKQDDEVDYLDRALIRELLEYMGRSREALALGLAQITVVRNLERAVTTPPTLPNRWCTWWKGKASATAARASRRRGMPYRPPDISTSLDKSLMSLILIELAVWVTVRKF